MADFGNGYEPVPGFMEKHCRTLTMFHDAAAYDAEVHGPGLLTGVSKFGKRIYYERLVKVSIVLLLCCAVALHPPSRARVAAATQNNTHTHTWLASA